MVPVETLAFMGRSQQCCWPVSMARSGEIAAHKVWMWRFIGSMWGAFWLFRVMLFVLGPIMGNIEAGAILVCIWFSAPLGIAITEWFRVRRLTGRPDVSAVAESLAQAQAPDACQ